jgi:hypothetical protein
VVDIVGLKSSINHIISARLPSSKRFVIRTLVLIIQGLKSSLQTHPIEHDITQELILNMKVIQQTDYRDNVFLVTNQGDISLPHQTAEDSILFNKYIPTTVGRLVTEKDNRLSNFGAIIFPSSFVVIGLGIIYFVLLDLIVETYIFDENAKTLTIKKKGLCVNEVVERSLGEISEVELKEVEVQTTKHNDGYTSYEVRLLMNGGNILSLGGSLDRQKQQKMTDLIRSYLDGRSIGRR